MLNLYLDTNILLAFYGLSSDDLEELRKLAVLLRDKHVRMYLPQQTEEEFARNRPTKIAEALKRLRDQKVALQIPQLAREYEEFAHVVRLQRELDGAFAHLIARVTTDIENSALKADGVVTELFSLATRIPTTEKLLHKARDRHALGNPPGKRDSLGDSLNWETLLAATPKNAALVFVTDDGDYASPLGDREFHPFLADEWKRLKSSHVAFYRRLSAFFADRFPEISLSRDEEKDRLIQRLAACGSFAATHAAINRLSGHVDFSVAQRNDILRAATTNNQIFLIIDDQDVRDFLQSVVKGYEDRLDSELLTEFKRLLEDADWERQTREDVAPKASQDTGDDLPF